MSIHITLSEEARQLIERLGTPAYILQGIAKALDLENQKSLQNIIVNHLTGKGPYPVDQHRLGERSKTYIKSVRTSPAQVSASTVSGTIGANVVYAGVHEEGFQGEVSVRGHHRTRTIQQVYLRLGKRKKMKIRKKDVAVWGHTRKLNIPARRPMQTGIEERLDETGAAISQAVIDAWKANQANQ